MRLPYLPKSFKKTELYTMNFLGVNLTDNYRDGELEDSRNLSSARFPALSQRKGRELLSDYDNVTDVYAWGDRLIVVADNLLYIDGKVITNVNDEPKQFAVVNTRLVVHPDMICVDLKNEKKTDMKASLTAKKGENEFKIIHNSLTFTLETVVDNDVKATFKGYSTAKWTPYTYTFGKNKTAFLECWDADTRSWNWAALNALKTERNLTQGFNDGGTTKIQDGEIVILGMEENSGMTSYQIPTGDAYTNKQPIPSTKFNAGGKYAVIKWDSKYDEDDFVGSGHQFVSHLIMDIYDAENRQPLLEDQFEVGDVLDMTGTPFKLFDTVIDNTNESMITVAKIKIKTMSCDEQTLVNVITVEDNTYSVPSYAKAMSAKTSPSGTKGFCIKAKTSTNAYRYITIDSLKSIGENSVLLVYGDITSDTVTVREWDKIKRKFLNEYTGSSGSSEPSSNIYAPTVVGSTFQSYIDTCDIVFQRAVPDLDFICERDNRLWGVSNKDGTIYGSGLGIPWLFYDYSGVDTDSYAVAVGSGGDFTGIVNYNGVLCFKEDRVHKLLGSYPSDFYINTYEVPGIQKDAHLSARVISEVLYYKSPTGVVAFTGYQPSDISRQLELENTLGGVAASDGREYYLCVKAKDGSHHSLFKYDLENKLWLKEEDIHVHSMCCHDSKVHLAISTYRDVVDEDDNTITVTDRRLWKTGQENGEVVEWFAQFKPFQEDVTISKRIMKPTGFVRLVLRLQMSPGATLTIKKRENDGRWEHVWNQPSTRKLVNTIPIKIGRCDKFELMLEGKGNTKIISMEREVIGNGKPNDVY